MDLVDNAVHDALEELPGEVVGLGRHIVRRCYGAEDDDLVGVSGQDTSGGLRVHT